MDYEEIKQGDKLYYGKKQVEVMAAPMNGKVPIRHADGYSVVDQSKLKLLDDQRLSWWWNGDNFVIQESGIGDANASYVHVPRRMIGKLVAAMKEIKPEHDHA